MIEDHFDTACEPTQTLRGRGKACELEFLAKDQPQAGIRVHFSRERTFRPIMSSVGTGDDGNNVRLFTVVASRVGHDN